MGITRGVILEAASLCAIRQKYHRRGYTSAEKTKIALRRRCPGISDRRLVNALHLAAAMYECAEQLLVAHRNRPATNRLLDQLARKLKSQFPMFRLRTLHAALHWAWYWRVLRASQ